MKSVHEHARLVYQAMHNAETARYKTASEAAECHAFDLIRERDSEHEEKWRVTAAAHVRIIDALRAFAESGISDIRLRMFREAEEALAELDALSALESSHANNPQ